MNYVLVDNSQVVSEPFLLNASGVVLPDGRSLSNPFVYSKDELLELGIYQVIDEINIDPRYQSAINPQYTLEKEHVRVAYQITEIPLEILKRQKINEVYQTVQRVLDALSSGYSQLEIATFPIIQAEILVYNEDNSKIGPQMQSITSRGRHTAQSLSDLLTPKINLQNDWLKKRDDLVADINAVSSAKELFLIFL